MTVTERLEGRLFSDTGVLRRAVAGRRVDRIAFLGYSVDGQTWAEPSGGPFDVTVEDGRRLEVRWQWRGDGGAPTSLVWRYRLYGVTGLRERRGVLHGS